MSIAETIAPTPERLKKAAGYDGPAVDRQTSRANHRMHSLVESIYRKGRLSKDCWSAYLRFEQDYTASQFYPSRICRYGSSTGSTPINQLTDAAMDAAEMGIERRLFAEQKANAAIRAVGGYPAKALLMAVQDTMDLVTIGRELSGYTGAKQASAAAVTLLLVASDLLCQHYDEG